MKSTVRFIISFFLITLLFGASSSFADNAPVLVQKYTLGVDAMSIWDLRAMQGKTYRAHHGWASFKQTVCTLSGFLDCSDQVLSKKHKGTAVYIPANPVLLMVPEGMVAPEEIAVIPVPHAPGPAQLFSLDTSPSIDEAAALSKAQLRIMVDTLTGERDAARAEVSAVQDHANVLYWVFAVIAGGLLGWIFLLYDGRQKAEHEARELRRLTHRLSVIDTPLDPVGPTTSAGN